MFSLDGKIAIVTGGGSGVGLATVKRFHKAGAKVVIADLTDQTNLAKEINGLFVKTDVTNEDDVKNLMKQATDTYGRIDIVVNNAGVTSEEPLEETSEENMLKNFKVNTLGVFFGMKHAIRYMIEGGAIVNTASTAGTKGASNLAAYGASKWAVVGLTKVAAIEFGPKNVRVNCICPSSIDTPMLANQEFGEIEKLVVSKGAPLGRINQPEDVAALIHFLVADDCPMVSGQAINIDGGASAGNSQEIVETLVRSANEYM